MSSKRRKKLEFKIRHFRRGQKKVASEIVSIVPFKLKWEDLENIIFIGNFILSKF